MASNKTVAPPPATYATAMDKLRDELAKSKDNYVRVVGEYLTEFLVAHPEAEGKIMDADKSIKGSLETVRKEAEKVKTGNVAVLDDKTVFGIVLGYYGIEGEATSSVTAKAATPSPKGEGKDTGEAIPKPSPKGEGGSAQALPEEVVPDPDPFDLDALLGGVG